MQRDANIPIELKGLKQWVRWEYNSKGAKIPRQLDGSTASSVDPQTWYTYDEVKDYPNIGFMFTRDDPYTGVDFDDCIVDGKLIPRVQEIIDNNPTYVEISPSGTGIKLWVNNEYQRAKGLNSKEMEVYSQKRYFTVTGQKIPQSKDFIGTCDRLIDDIKHRYPEDGIKEQQEFRSIKSAAVREWYTLNDVRSIEGENGDQALYAVAKTCFRYGLNIEEARYELIEFNETRCTPKWTLHEINHKLESAINQSIRENWFNTESANAVEGFTAMGGFFQYDDLPPVTEIDHMWDDFIPRGSMSILAAPPKMGKSTILVDLISKAHEGGEFLGREVKPSKILMLSEEHRDYWAKRVKDIGGKTGLVGYDKMDELRTTTGWSNFWNMSEVHDFDLIIVDTLNGIAPPFVENSADTVMNILNPMRAATHEGVAILLIHHTAKNYAGNDPVQALRGSGAIPSNVDNCILMRPVGETTSRTLHVKGRSCGAFDVSVSWSESGGYVEGLGNDHNAFLMERLSFGAARLADMLEWDWPGKKPSRSTLSRLLKNGPFKSVNSNWTLDNGSDPEED